MINNSHLKSVIVGLGKMGVHHYQAIKSLDIADVVAIVDVADSSDISSASGSGLPTFRDLDALFSEIKPDVVHICTPPASHYDLSKLAIENGCHVYVEKPFCPSTSEARDLIEMAHKAGIEICAGHQLLYEKPARASRELMSKIGNLVHVESYFSFSQVRRNLTSSEQLLDILPHPVYLLVEFMQRGESACANMKTEILSMDATPTGDVHALLKLGRLTGALHVTLRGRPVDSYLKLVGTNGSVHADFTLGMVKDFIGPGSSTISLVINRFIEARQIAFRSTTALLGRLLKRKKSYPGLSELIEAFYSSIKNHTEPPITPASILETVRICEAIGEKLGAEEARYERHAIADLHQRELELPPESPDSGIVLVTGGTGFLGSRVSSDLRKDGYPVRVITRRMPPPSKRAPGVEYHVADLSKKLPADAMTGVSIIVHCAAETSGGREAHQRNSIAVTRNILLAAAEAHVHRLIHVSSVAVLKAGPHPGDLLSEESPVDAEESRGPYVWGKAMSEGLALDLGERLGIAVRIVRPGPLVDYHSFIPPGRLGKAIGNIFLAFGSKTEPLFVCDIETAVDVIKTYVRDFESCPLFLNLLDPAPPTRVKLVNLLLNRHYGFKVVWVPSALLNIADPLLLLMQSLVRPGTKPVSVRAAFSSPRYSVNLAQSIIWKANRNGRA